MSSRQQLCKHELLVVEVAVAAVVVVDVVLDGIVVVVVDNVYHV